MTKAVVKKPVDRLTELINKKTVQEQFKNAMGKHSDLFVASLIDIFNDGLHECEPGLVIQEALKAAVLKLPIAKSLGFAYIVPYNKSYKEGSQWRKKVIPQFQIGYKGLGQLAQRSGQLKILNPDVVYEGEFKGKNRLTGQIDLTGKKISDDVVGYFVYMELINGFQKMEYWPKKKVVAHAEKYSQAYQNGVKYNKKKSAWFTDFDAMAIKTVLRSVLSKHAPLSVDFVAAMTYDTNQDEAIQPADINLDMKDITPPPPDSKPKEQKTVKPPKTDETPIENIEKATPVGNSELQYVAHLEQLNIDPHMQPSLQDIFALPHIPVTQAKIDDAIARKDEVHAKNIIELVNKFIG